MSYPYGETVTVRTRVQGPDDQYGQPTWTWTDVDVPGVAVAPAAGNEAGLPYRQDVGIALTVYLPPETPITARSRVLVRGDEFEVFGEPGDWRSPFTGWHPGIVANLTRSEG